MMEVLRNFIEKYLISCDIPNLLAVSVLLFVIAPSIAIAQYMLIGRLLKDKCDIRRELINLRSDLTDYFKILVLIIVAQWASTFATDALIDLIYHYYGYDLWGVEGFLVQVLVSGVFGTIGYLLGRYLTKSSPRL